MNGKTLRIVPLIMALAVIPGFAAPRTAPDAAPADSFTNLLDNSLRQHMALTRFRHYVPASRLGSTTPAKILKAVEDGTGLRIHVDWAALETLGLDPNQQVTIPVKPVTYDRLLHILSARTGVAMVLSYDGPGGIFTLTAGDPSEMTEVKDPAAPMKAHVPSVKEQAVRRKLEMTIDKMQLDQQSFESALRMWQQKTGANLDINWTALQAAGIDKNTPVSIDVHDVTAEKTLATLVDHVAGGSVNLGYTVDENLITISTSDDLNSPKYQILCVYNIHRYVASPNPRHLVFDDRIKNLVDAIKGVAPDSWRDNGGTIGSLRQFDEFLIINQTKENHLMITNLLRTLHAIDRGPSKVDRKVLEDSPKARARSRFE